MQSLEQFMDEMKKDITAFERYWRENNAKNPEMYPMEFIAGDEGSWCEQFVIFCESSHENATDETEE